MNSTLEQNCQLLVRNQEAMKKAFRWENGTMMLAASSFYVGMHLEADIEKLKACEELLKRKTGFFSAFRGNVCMPVICKMAVSENPEQYLDDIDVIVQQMKSLKWIDTNYKILAALTMREHLSMEEIASGIDKMVSLYQGMKDNHPWLTTAEDVPFAAILAVSGFDTAALLTEMEACYELLSKSFSNKNAVQSLSHILAIDSAATVEKCHKVKDIYDILKTNKHKFGSGCELAVLGTLSMLDLSVEQITQEIMEADDYLKQEKGFGKFSMGDGMRRMYAALMVMDTHMPSVSYSHESLVNSVLSLVIAMEVCMVMMMTSVAAATASN